MSCLSTYSSLAGAGGFGARCINIVGCSAKSSVVVWLSFTVLLASQSLLREVGYKLGVGSRPTYQVVFPKMPSREVTRPGFAR